MAGPMQGIKVVEMGVWVAGPSCAAILADWGADVIKIEPPAGDPFRGLFASALGAAIPVNPPFEQMWTAIEAEAFTPQISRGIEREGRRSIVHHEQTSSCDALMMSFQSDPGRPGSTIRQSRPALSQRSRTSCAARCPTPLRSLSATTVNASTPFRTGKAPKFPASIAAQVG